MEVFLNPTVMLSTYEVTWEGIGIYSFTRLLPKADPQFGSILWICNLEAKWGKSYNKWEVDDRMGNTLYDQDLFTLYIIKESWVFCWFFQKLELYSSKCLFYHHIPGLLQ